MTVITLLALCLFDDHLSPLEAYKLNYSALRVRGDYVFSKGHIPYEAVSQGKVWGASFDSAHFTSTSVTSGEWGLDGKTEKYVVEIPGSPPGETPVHKPQRYEVLFDGLNSAVSKVGTNTIMAAKGPAPPQMS
ncbi:MAG: hypothetical protein ACP5XB_03970, partial [Isosphaeraceae bacterium]